MATAPSLEGLHLCGAVEPAEHRNLTGAPQSRRCIKIHGHIELRHSWEEEWQEPTEQVDHPAHYGGADDPYEAIKVIEAWGLGFCLGNTLKYISRAGKKGPKSQLVEDLKKARWYLDREISNNE